MTTPSLPRGRGLAIPGLRAIRTYDRSWLPVDALAGLTVWALLVPQALAYAQLGGFDPVVGLYASVGALLGYALMGGVREMSVGPEATIALLTASIIAPLAEGDPSRYLALGAGVALMAGILLVLAGIARLGFVTRYLSRPLLVGYVAGSAIVMIVSQLDSLIGITLVAQDDTLAELGETIRRLGETDLTTLAVGLGVIAIVLVVKRIDRRLPAYLVGVLAAIVVSVALGLEAQGVKVVGDIPPGLPPLGLPDIGLADIQLLLVPAAALGLLIYADSGVTGQVLGRRGGYRVDGDGEFLGLAGERERALAEFRERIDRRFPPVTEDTMPGELSNCIAGRIANLYNFHGANYVTDAACASALAAMSAAVDGLAAGHFDTVLTGGLDRNMGPTSFVKFCKIGALSATGTRPYADGADGFVMGEGAAFFLLKRLADAERDGDRIYAVIRGVGGSSDGRGKGITAPNPVGQRFAIRHGWQTAGLDPATCSLIEGHGTSTKVGDVVEVEASSRRSARPAFRSTRSRSDRSSRTSAT